MIREAVPARRRKVHWLQGEHRTACGRAADDRAVRGFTTTRLADVTCANCLARAREVSTA